MAHPRISISRYLKLKEQKAAEAKLIDAMERAQTRASDAARRVPEEVVTMDTVEAQNRFECQRYDPVAGPFQGTMGDATKDYSNLITRKSVPPMIYTRHSNYNSIARTAISNLLATATRLMPERKARTAYERLCK